MFALKDPRLTKSETLGDFRCYTMESTIVVMNHVTQTCWNADKIVAIVDRSEYA
jgi:hypothetical protein